MKGMKSAQEFYTPPAPGRYLSLIETAEAKLSDKGNTMIKLGLKIIDPNFPQYKDTQCNDHIITDGTAKGGGMGKIKLRALGVLEKFGEVDDDIPDGQICGALIGTQIYVEYGNEPQMTKESNYTSPATVIHNGQTITLQKLNVKGYARHSVGGAAPVAQAPVQQVPQLQQVPVQMAPQGQYAQVPQYAPQAPQGYAPQAPQGWQGQPQPVQQWQGQPQGFVPQGAPVQPQYAQQAVPPWNGNGVAQLPPAPPAETKGSRKKLKVDAAEGE